MTELQDVANKKTQALEEMLNKKAEIEKAITEEAKIVFAEVSKDIFEKYGDKIGCFRWSQYTPYFNDGEPCEFSKHDVWIFTPEDAKNEDLRYEEGSEQFYSGYGENDKLSKILYRSKERDYVTSGTWIGKERLERDYESFENPNFDPEWGDAYTAVHDLCNLIDEDTALALFGDHVEVVVTANGVEVDDYDHD